MFNVGGGEILLIALVALLVLGPERLPGALRQAGKVMGELRRISSGFQTDLKSALAEAEREAEAEQRKTESARAELEAAKAERGIPSLGDEPSEITATLDSAPSDTSADTAAQTPADTSAPPVESADRPDGLVPPSAITPADAAPTLGFGSAAPKATEPTPSTASSPEAAPDPTDPSA